MPKKKRKICFVITSTIHYGRSKLILEELRDRKDIDLRIVLGGSAILPQYGDVPKLMVSDGFKSDAEIVMSLEGGTPVAMAKTAGLGITEFATAFDNLKPDVVVVRGDRYEVLSAAVAASFLNIPVAHIEGGDVSGSIDGSVRHAITKLSHIHFATNDESRERILRMGERPDYVFNVGCPGLEFVHKNNYRVTNKLINLLGVGDYVDIREPYLMVVQHPVTSEMGKNEKHIEETLHAVNDLGVQTIWFWPNIDAGTDEVSKGMRSFRENNDLSHIRFIKYLPPEEFIGLLKGAACLVGNSSAGLKECSYLGIGVVNIGTRQHMRMRGKNVIDVEYDRNAIKRAIKQQLKHGPHQSSDIYSKDDTSKNIVEILSKIDLYAQKQFYEA